MPDDLQIPVVTAPPGRAPMSTTYRPRAAGYRGTRTIPLRTAAMAGAAGCGVLLAVIGGWGLLHRHPAAVPVIEADARPVRVKPENPGGMQVADADDASPGEQRMAPPAEAPAPQALRAQVQPAAPAPAAAPPAAAPPVAALPVTALPASLPPQAALPPVTPSGVSPLPDTPKPTARTAPAPAARATPAAGTAAPAGGTAVQVAAVDTEAGAQAEWQRLQKRMPDVLADRHPLTQKAERDGKPIWRVRIAGFTDIADATGFCAKVRARGGNCAIASF